MPTLLATLVSGLFLGQASAAQWVVAADGDDGGSGNAAAPFATLQRAANAVTAGDTVRVLPGTYAGFLVDSDAARIGRADARVTWVASGPAGSVVIDRAGPDNYVRNGTQNHFDLTRTHYWTIDGFTFESPTRAGVGVLGSADDPAIGVVVRNVTVRNGGAWGIFTGHTEQFTAEFNDCSGSVREHGIYVSNTSHDAWVRGNHLWDNNGSGLHMNGDVSAGGDGYVYDVLVEDNVIHGNGASGGSGINCDGCVGAVIRNNILYDNRASGISIFTQNAAGPSRDNTVVNNTILQPDPSHWAVNIANGATGTVVFNNLLVHAPAFQGVLAVCADCLDGFVSDYNVFNARFTLDGDATILDIAGWRAAGYGAHSVVIDGLPAAMVDPADRRTQEGSPAVDVGIAELAGRAAPEVDHLGLARPAGAGWDAGAIEVGANPPDPDPDPEPGPDPDPDSGEGEGEGEGEGGSGAQGFGEGPPSTPSTRNRDDGCDCGVATSADKVWLPFIRR